MYFGNTDEALAATDAHGYFVPVKLHVPAAAVPGMHAVSAKGRTSGRSARRHFTVATPWDQFGRVPSHTHANPYENVLSPGNVSGLTQVWSYATGGAVASSPAVVHGVVYAGSYDHRVYALNAATGAKLWSHRTGGAIMSSPAVADGVVYIGGGAHIYALNAKTGAKLWSYSTGPAAHSFTGHGVKSAFPGYDVYSSPAVSHGVVYAGSANTTIYALNVKTGALLWRYQAGAPIMQGSPAVANGVVYAASYDSLYALNAASGALLWSSGSAWGNSSPAVAHGVVYAGSFDDSVYAFDAVTGAQRWSYPTGDQIFSSSPAVANGVVYIGSTDGNVYALGAGTGAKLWSYPIGSEAAPVVVNGMVYVSANNSVYAFGLPAKPAALAGRVSRPRQRSGKDHAPHARTAASRTPTRDHRPARSRQSRR